MTNNNNTNRNDNYYVMNTHRAVGKVKFGIKYWITHKHGKINGFLPLPYIVQQYACLFRECIAQYEINPEGFLKQNNQSEISKNCEP